MFVILESFSGLVDDLYDAFGLEIRLASLLPLLSTRWLGRNIPKIRFVEIFEIQRTLLYELGP